MMHGDMKLKKKDSQCTYNVTLRPVRATVVIVEKQRVLHTVCVCVCVCVFVALVIQHAMRMCHIPICGLSALKYFPTLKIL